MIFDAINLAIALVGVACGVIALRHQLDSARVRLRVVPKVARALHPSMMSVSGNDDATGDQLCIEVVNLSAFAVTIAMVGLRTTRAERNARNIVLVSPIIRDGGEWPRRLQPHESVTVYFGPKSPVNSPAEMRTVRFAFAQTSSGVICRGSSPALRRVVQRAKHLIQSNAN
ncbi:MAG: hypothetical protein R3B68_02450 [Phycisphaerales bacterium]